MPPLLSFAVFHQSSHPLVQNAHHGPGKLPCPGKRDDKRAAHHPNSFNCCGLLRRHAVALTMLMSVLAAAVTLTACTR
jgi:hypothetical protein